MTRNALILFMLLASLLPAAVAPAPVEAARSDNCTQCGNDLNAGSRQRRYPLMKVTAADKAAEAERAERMPQAAIDKKLKQQLADRTEGASLSLLPHLDYDPGQRYQGDCGNCWVWAATALTEIAMDVQHGVKDRLSIQYLNSNYGGTSACCGGLIDNFVSFYNTRKMAIPWSNENATYADNATGCYDPITMPAASISTAPNYAINSISSSTISTHSVGENTSIANIKNILNQGKAAYFALYLANGSDWDQFFDFWDFQAESAIWPNGFSCGEAYTDGGGHAVPCVGYNDDDADPSKHYWVMLNSWGTTALRPNGLFRIPMHYDYDCHDSLGRWNTFWYSLNVTFATPLPISSYGWVGVGIDPPQKILHVSGTGPGTVPLFQRGVDSAGFIIERTTTNRWAFGVNENATLGYGFVISTIPQGTTSVPRLVISPSGNVTIPGTLSAGAKNFRIDHPLHPAGSYLLHSFVESPDMLNLYSGNVVLDANGEAVIELPAYFGALNRDYSYQIDAVGGFAPLYVKQEISDNKFTIAGGSPGLKASWQVAGTRHDPYAASHPLTVEQEKPAGEKGFYLYPAQ